MNNYQYYPLINLLKNMILTITKPDDWHLHLRDGAFLATTVSHAASQFERAIVMPNLKPPICYVTQAEKYRQTIIEVLPAGSTFQPLMTLYLTDQTTPENIQEAKKSGLIFGYKLYPAGATTHSDSGVTQFERLFPIFESMQKVGLPLLIHGEVTDSHVDIFDREARFFETTLASLVEQFPELRIVAEHITTKEAVDFISATRSNVGATITAHHLLMNRNDIFKGGIRPHHYCLPILKRQLHQEALIRAATSGSSKFFLGTDSAPHSKETKESTCGCAGIYTAHAAIPLYCEVFEQANALDKLEAFSSFHGSDFYQLPRNNTFLTLVKEDWQVPDYYPYANTQLIPFRAGETIHWKIKTHD